MMKSLYVGERLSPLSSVSGIELRGEDEHLSRNAAVDMDFIECPAVLLDHQRTAPDLGEPLQHIIGDRDGVCVLEPCAFAIGRSRLAIRQDCLVVALVLSVGVGKLWQVPQQVVFHDVHQRMRRHVLQRQDRPRRAAPL
jgi:hypothetical protein